MTVGWDDAERPMDEQHLLSCSIHYQGFAKSILAYTFFHVLICIEEVTNAAHKLQCAL